MSNRLLFTRNLSNQIKYRRYLKQQSTTSSKPSDKLPDYCKSNSLQKALYEEPQTADSIKIRDLQLACRYWQRCNCYEKPFLFKVERKTNLHTDNTFDDSYLQSSIENRNFLSDNVTNRDFYGKIVSQLDQELIVYTNGKACEEELKAKKHLFSSQRKINKPSSDHPTEEQLFKLYTQLSYELPNVLKNGIDYATHTKDVYFENEYLKLKTRGLLPYKIQIKTLLFLIKLWWSGKSFNILKITRHDFDGTIRIRWQLTGRPRILTPLILLRGAENLQSDYQRSIDGFSILFVNKDGRIDYHKLSKVMPTTCGTKKTTLATLLSLLGSSPRLRPTNQLPEEPVTQSQ